MAPVLYFLAGVLAGASWTLIGYTVAHALAPRHRRAAGLVALVVIVGFLAPLVFNRPRHTPLGVLLGALIGFVLLGLGGAAGGTSRALELPPAGRPWSDPDSRPVDDVRRAIAAAERLALRRPR